MAIYFCGRHHHLVDRYETSISQMTMDLLIFTQISPSITAKTLIGLDCIYEQHNGCLLRSRNCLPFASTWVHSWVRVAHRFCCLCCPIMCLYVLSSVLFVGVLLSYLYYLCLFAHSGVHELSCLIYVICVCLHIVLSFILVLFFVCLRPVSCMPNAAGFSGLSILDCPFGFL